MSKEKIEFSVNDWRELKEIAVKAQQFELASKCREMEKNHVDYVPPKKKRGRPRKNKWVLSVDVGKSEFDKLNLLIGLTNPKGQQVSF